MRIIGKPLIFSSHLYILRKHTTKFRDLSKFFFVFKKDLATKILLASVMFDKIGALKKCSIIGIFIRRQSSWNKIILLKNLFLVVNYLKENEYFNILVKGLWPSPAWRWAPADKWWTTGLLSFSRRSKTMRSRWSTDSC